MHKKNLKRYIILLLTIVCILFIWINSSFNGVESTKQSGFILNIINNLFNKLGLATISEILIRKFAHFTEYACLGVLLTLDVYLWRFSIKRMLPAIAFVGLLVACIDETIQIYSLGRSSSLIDVWIDFAGLSLAIIITTFIVKNVKKNRIKI